MQITVYGNRAGGNFRVVRNGWGGGFRVYVHLPRKRELALWVNSWTFGA